MSDATQPDMTPSPSPLDDACNPENEPNSAQPNAASQESEEEWQTVNFPGALNIDVIPVDATQAEPVNEQPPPLDQVECPEESDRNGLITQLQQENATLQTQIATLESDLSQLQIELQLEVARFYCKETETETPEAEIDRQDTVTLDAAQTQVQHLTQDLQASQQTIQQQAHEIDTLTHKLDESQQRIAQLERDCALSQQRYKEQLQLVAQAEDTCQDLRMRLHRQQQQTLQFKAALEKSIEMNASLEMTQVEPAATISHPEQQTHASDNPAAFIPKARPVQPWSTAPGLAAPAHSGSRHHASGLPNLLAKLARQPAIPAAVSPSDEPTPAPPFNATEAIEVPAEPTPAAVDAASQQILEFLFPDRATPATPHSAPPAAAVFDLSPFIEAGEVDTNTIPVDHDNSIEPAIHPPTTSAIAPTPEEASHQPKDGLWADLARLIEPDLAHSDEAPLATPKPSEPVANSPSLAQPADSGQTTRSINLVSFAAEPSVADSLVPEETFPQDLETIAPNPFPSFTLRQPGEGEVEEAAIAANVPIFDSADTPVPTGFPSPILYPARQPKKLASMAAVDLPSFPRG
ncbi:MAG: hypothetical protein NW224_15070 [Leptolyngbyaceae cyanobacterium bins.302]|nr:hypothetical protein [Leptolyngbyaceae cyanobacterium bins.302]